MSEPNSDFTNEPQRSEQHITEPSEQSAFAPETVPSADHAERVLAKPSKSLLSTVIMCLMLGSLLVLCAGVLLAAISRIGDASRRSQTHCNIKQMVLALNNLASNSQAGDIPPANGEFPIGSGKSGSFFYHLLPYIEQANLYTPQPPDVPVQTYIAKGDSRNPGTNSTISYCTNGTLLSQPNPRWPDSFGGRTSGVIVLMERSGMDGRHKWTNANNVLGTPGNPPPFPQIDVSPAAYLDGSPQGLSSAGCVVGLGDGSSRTVTSRQANAWNWACDPADRSPQPSEW